MTIVGCRIDGRLIHGQVANLWSAKLDVSRIMVVDNDVVNNDVEKSGLKLATPPGVKLSILPVDKAAANILAGKYDSQRLLIVARKPDRFLGLVEAGVPLETLNVGNMSQTPETRAITRSINVVDKAAANILAGKYDSQRLLIVARKPDRFLGLVEAGVPLETVNVGNMSQTPETRPITRSINVVDKDVEDFHKLAEKGVKLTAQMVPNDPVSDFLSLLK